jgi:Tol biopolymer transport system component
VRAALALCALSSIVAAATGACAATGAHPGRDGRIAFLSGTDGATTRVFTVNPDGTRPVVVYSCDSSTRELCNFPLNRAAAFSPNGTTFALVPGPSLAIAGADGANFRTLPHEQGFDRSPSWSPRGDRIAFVRTDGAAGDVYTVRVDGTGLRRITRGAGAVEVAWSNRNEIAYATTRAGKRGRVVAVDSSGKHRRVLVDRGAPTALDWTPSGAHLNYTSHGRAEGLWTVDRKGKRPRPLAPGIYDAIASPSGRRIAYQGEDGFTTANRDGASPRPIDPQVPADWGVPYLQAWQPLPQ